MSDKPYLFIDFDRTLFNTELFYDWLGDDFDGRVAQLIEGTLTPPDFTRMLYQESIPFLVAARAHYRLVILTFATSDKLQRMKLSGSGVLAYVDDAIVTSGDKGEAAKEYVTVHGVPGTTSAFVDDKEGMLKEVHRALPEIQLFRLIRPNERQAKGARESVLGTEVPSLMALLTLLS